MFILAKIFNLINPFMQKHVDRSGQAADKIFDSRTLQNDYRTLVPLIKPGMKVLDVGCGTGAISKGIAEIVGETGLVIGIDNTLDFIESGQKSNSNVTNLDLIHVDLMNYEPSQKFDLVVSARTLQWLCDPTSAIEKMKAFLKPNATLSILDYNHEDIEWQPAIPQSMQDFYSQWLKWRSDSGMNNRIAEDLPSIFEKCEFSNIEVLESNEFYTKEHPFFSDKLAVWKKVASSTQLVKEGYISDELRLQAINDYQNWIDHEALSMKMILKEVRAKVNEA